MNRKLLSMALVSSLSVACGGGANYGKVTGKIDGVREFGEVQSALWIGKPDADNAGKTIVYIFSAPATCAELAKSTWEGNRPLESQMFEVITAASEAKTYTLQDEGEIEHKFLKNDEARDAVEGKVVLTKVVAGTSVSGSFEGKFRDPVMAGVTHPASATFEASWCPDGVEP